MNLSQKIGQVLCVGFDGVAFNDEMRGLIQDLRVGGLIVFERNVGSRQALKQMLGDAQDCAQACGLPRLFIGIDQEGGRVTRLRSATGFTEFPSARDVANSPDPVRAVRQQAQVMAGELREVGININFAPVLDVNNNPDNPVIGNRSFGDDPILVSQLGVAYIETVQAAGVMCVGKHFPGHGDVAVDSHLGLPNVPHNRERLEAIEFAPFKAAMRAGVGGIMSAHVSFPAIEPSGLPATLSPNVMTSLLRDELGYDGLLFTDSLEMGALATSGYPVPIAAATALKAGADVLLFNSGAVQRRAAHAEMLAWVQRGDIPQTRIDAAVQRVLHAKQKFIDADLSPI